MKLHQLGPGILLAATSIGASHILMSPEAGARFGYQLVWLVVATHLVKYPAFACAPRYVAARGESLLDAYAHAPGPKGWAIWLGLVDMTVQAVGLVAALVGLTGSFLVAALGGLGVAGWSLALTAVLLALLRFGRYGSLRWINLALMIALAIGTVVAFVAAAPPVGEVLRGSFRPGLPAGSLLLVCAILGFMPTSVAVSIWQSLWALEQGRFVAVDGTDLAERERRLRGGLADLRVGYLLSAVLAVLFVTLGALLLQPRGLVPEGPRVALILARLYTESLGAWIGPLFLALAFFALFSTCYTMMDGFPRSFIAATRVLSGRPATGTPAAAEPVYWAFLLVVTFGGMALLASVPDPAFLVKAVGAVGLLFSPVYFALNLWAVTRRIDSPALRLGRAGLAAGLLGVAFMIFTAALLLWTTFAPGLGAHAASSAGTSLLGRPS